jgi:hypothetical protein
MVLAKKGGRETNEKGNDTSRSTPKQTQNTTDGPSASTQTPTRLETTRQAPTTLHTVDWHRNMTQRKRRCNVWKISSPNATHRGLHTPNPSHIYHRLHD